MIITRYKAGVRPLRGLARRPSPGRVGEATGAGGARRPPPTGFKILVGGVLLAKPGALSLEVLGAYQPGGTDASPIRTLRREMFGPLLPSARRITASSLLLPDENA
eukprot:6211184-Pleurochrysis_carterae.AAC.1